MEESLTTWENEIDKEHDEEKDLQQKQTINGWVE